MPLWGATMARAIFSSSDMSDLPLMVPVGVFSGPKVCRGTRERAAARRVRAGPWDGRRWALAAPGRVGSGGNRRVRQRGFEPPRGCPRQPLKLVRLPVPPLPRTKDDWPFLEPAMPSVLFRLLFPHSSIEFLDDSDLTTLDNRRAVRPRLFPSIGQKAHSA